MTVCRPPSAAITSTPGRCARWYALASTIVAPASSSCAGVTPLTEPWVATGMNAGVSTTPWGVVSRPRRAPPGLARRTSNEGALT